MKEILETIVLEKNCINNNRILKNDFKTSPRYHIIDAYRESIIKTIQGIHNLRLYNPEMKYTYINEIRYAFAVEFIDSIYK